LTRHADDLRVAIRAQVLTDKVGTEENIVIQKQDDIALGSPETLVSRLRRIRLILL
jgi:hypothetical protein